MDATRLLILAANPDEQTSLALGREAREISLRLREARYRDCVALHTEWAVRPVDMMRALDEHMPHIVHFCGHGNQEQKLLLEDDEGTAKPVDAAALASVFHALKRDIRLVVFNTCYSHTLAQTLAAHIDCAIGSSHPLSDPEAIVFAGTLYRALASGHSVGHAFEQGVAALHAEGVTSHESLMLFTRTREDGCRIDPYRVMLITGRAQPAVSAREEARAAARRVHREMCKRLYALGIVLMVCLGSILWQATSLWGNAEIKSSPRIQLLKAHAELCRKTITIQLDYSVDNLPGSAELWIAQSTDARGRQRTSEPRRLDASMTSAIVQFPQPAPVDTVYVWLYSTLAGSSLRAAEAASAVTLHSCRAGAARRGDEWSAAPIQTRARHDLANVQLAASLVGDRGDLGQIAARLGLVISGFAVHADDARLEVVPTGNRLQGHVHRVRHYIVEPASKTDEYKWARENKINQKPTYIKLRYQLHAGRLISIHGYGHYWIRFAMQRQYAGRLAARSGGGLHNGSRGIAAHAHRCHGSAHDLCASHCGGRGKYDHGQKIDCPQHRFLSFVKMGQRG